MCHLITVPAISLHEHFFVSQTLDVPFLSSWVAVLTSTFACLLIIFIHHLVHFSVITPSFTSLQFGIDAFSFPIWHTCSTHGDTVWVPPEGQSRHAAPRDIPWRIRQRRGTYAHASLVLEVLCVSWKCMCFALIGLHAVCWLWLWRVKAIPGIRVHAIHRGC